MHGTVLILDDDAGVLDLTALYLKSKGFSTLACTSAASASQKFEEASGNVAILVADVTLSDSSGVETALRLKALQPCAQEFSLYPDTLLTTGPTVTWISSTACPPVP
jgi:DNA-binding response OmpR family regulator